MNMEEVLNRNPILYKNYLLLEPDKWVNTYYGHVYRNKHDVDILNEYIIGYNNVTHSYIKAAIDYNTLKELKFVELDFDGLVDGVICITKDNKVIRCFEHICRSKCPLIDQCDFCVMKKLLEEN
jgi:hypothetical protein